MTNVADVCRYLESFAPAALAEDWDNVGLLMGDRQASVSKVMTCLTVTSAVAEEAIAENVNNNIMLMQPLQFLLYQHPDNEKLLKDQLKI